MRQAQVWQVKRSIDFLSAHRRLGRIDDDVAVAVALHQCGRLYLVAFELDDMVVFGFGALGLEAVFEGVEFDGVRGYMGGIG